MQCNKNDKSNQITTGGNLIRFIIFITLHIGKSGEIGGFGIFYFTDGKIKMAEGIFPTS